MRADTVFYVRIYMVKCATNLCCGLFLYPDLWPPGWDEGRNPNFWWEDPVVRISILLLGGSVIVKNDDDGHQGELTAWHEIRTALGEEEVIPNNLHLTTPRASVQGGLLFTCKPPGSLHINLVRILWLIFSHNHFFCSCLSLILLIPFKSFSFKFS